MLKYIQHNLGIVLVLATCILSLFIFKDYGISWDEDTQRETGKLTHDYVFNGDDALLQWPDKDYGVGFEWPLYIVEKALDLNDSRDIYLSRHILTHLFFLVGAFFCFLLIDFVYQNKWLATIGFLMLILHPRIYAHSFFNTKDIPFLAMFIICLFLNAKAFKSQKTIYFIVLGLSYGFLINLRLMGVLLPVLTLTFLIYDYYKKRKSLHLKFAIWLSIASALSLYITWPYLWSNPVSNFFDAFLNMSKFRWYGEQMFKGNFIKGYDIDWTYIPTWFGITNPIVYLILGFSGIFLLIKHVLKAPKKYLDNNLERNQLFFLASFFTPIVVVIVLQSVLYDGWRQLYFIYPSFIMFAVYAMHKIFSVGFKKIAIPVIFLAFAWIAFFMVKNHPHQHIYFNKLTDTKTPEFLRTNYELDYWGTSYKQAYEYILDRDDSELIKIKVENIPGTLNQMILPKMDRERVQLVETYDEADYYITNYRGHYHDYKEVEDKKWYAIKVLNNSICSIFKLKP